MNRRRARLTSKLHFNFGTSSCLYVYSFSAFAYKLKYCTRCRVFVVLGFDSVCTVRAARVSPSSFGFISFVCFLAPCAQLNTFVLLFCGNFFSRFEWLCVCVLCCFFRWFSSDSRDSHLIFLCVTFHCHFCFGLFCYSRFVVYYNIVCYGMCACHSVVYVLLCGLVCMIFLLVGISLLWLFFVCRPSPPPSLFR